MMQLIKQQVDFGPRYISAPGHERTADFIAAEARAIASFDGKVTEQRWEERGSDSRTFELRNIMLSLQPDNPRRIIVGSHYDSKRTADQDSKDREAPVPGANDSASGVAVLLEAARAMAAETETPPVGIDFVFFDGEEGLPFAGSDTEEWKPLGSTYFARTVPELYPTKKPEGGIVFDMVCDRNLGIMQEASSRKAAPEQVRRFWDIGNSLRPGAFLPPTKDMVSDDHTPLNHAGIPSFLVIDFDYPAYHTQNDTIDKCSPQSLETVADTLLRYINGL